MAVLTAAQVLDTVALYWLSGTGGSSARFYRENFPPDNAGEVGVPSAVTVFPADIEKVPRAWVERRFTDLRSLRVVERGGHFPMLEVPGSDTVLQTCVSPSGRYAAVLIAPRAVDNPFDRYQLPLPERLLTHLVEVDTGQEVVALQGFDLSWCQVPPQ